MRRQPALARTSARCGVHHPLWMLAACATLSLCGCSGSARSSAPKTAESAARPRPKPEAAEDPAARPGSVSISPAAAKAYAAGQAAFRGGDLDGAAEQFSKAVQSDPKACAARVALGTVAERRGQSAQALQAYAAALAIVPDYAPAVSARVRLLLALERAPEAEAFARGLVAQHPDSAPALAALAEVLSSRGDSRSAQELAQRALKKDPDYRPAMVTLARDHYRARRLDLALYTLTAILDGYGPENPPRDKNNADAHFLRALILKERGKRKAAIDELTTVIELRPDLIDARLHLAAFMLEAGNAADARPVLEKALEYDAANVLVHLNLGDAYRLLGKPEDALQHLNWVARKDPSLAQAQYDIGLVYLFSASVPGNTEEQAIDRAIEAFEKFEKLEPRAPRGAGDDAEELIARARNKKAILQAMKAQTGAPAGAPQAPGG
jgi:tetratricopeptide (TPR) repeat protein